MLDQTRWGMLIFVFIFVFIWFTLPQPLVEKAVWQCRLNGKGSVERAFLEIDLPEKPLMSREAFRELERSASARTSIESASKSTCRRIGESSLNTLTPEEWCLLSLISLVFNDSQGLSFAGLGTISLEAISSEAASDHAKKGQSVGEA